MSDGDSARQARDLRDHTISLLREAVRCDDPARCDCLIREALARLAEARLLLRLDDEAESIGPSSTRRTY